MANGRSGLPLRPNKPAVHDPPAQSAATRGLSRIGHRRRGSRSPHRRQQETLPKNGYHLPRLKRQLSNCAECTPQHAVVQYAYLSTPSDCTRPPAPWPLPVGDVDGGDGRPALARDERLRPSGQRGAHRGGITHVAAPATGRHSRRGNADPYLEMPAETSAKGTASFFRCGKQTASRSKFVVVVCVAVRWRTRWEMIDLCRR
jgi:hypothetical protein